MNIPPQYALGALVAAIVFVIAVIKTDVAFILLIFSMLFSPEFQVGAVPGREVVWRFDDVMLFVVFFGWLAKLAVNKEMGLLRPNPVNRPILFYVGACVFSSLVGALQGTNDPRQSVFYIVKYTQYFMIFFMVANHVSSVKQARKFIFFILLTAFLVGIYAQLFHVMPGARATAPFEGEAGEPNTLAGYLLIMISLATGMLLYARRGKRRILLSGFLAFLIIPFLFTLSRAGWMGMMVVLVSFLLFTRRNRDSLVVALFVMLILSFFFMPETVEERFHSTFLPGRTYAVMGRSFTVAESAALRVDSWQASFKVWLERPIFGRGVPGGGSVSDVQYTRILRETGIVGFLVFIWIMSTLFKAAFRTFNDPEVDDAGQGIALGFICALAGLLAMGVAIEFFILIRIMEPFWFLAAIVVVLPDISRRKEIT